MTRYFVRVGALGDLVIASAMIGYERGRRVILRSKRGIEIAEVVAPCDQSLAGKTAFRIIRPTTDSDERLATRLEKHKREAVEACRVRLDKSGSQSILLDVDQFLDGATLKLHFLGDVDAMAQSIADEVAEQYEAVVKTDHLADLLRDGCGTDCGSESSGCGSCAGCSTCG